jgi:hypothetical protein
VAYGSEATSYRQWSAFMTKVSQAKDRANTEGKWMLLHSVLSTAVANIANVDKVYLGYSSPSRRGRILWRPRPSALSILRLSLSVTLFPIINVSVVCWIFVKFGKQNIINFRFSPCIIIVNHFYYPTNALNYTKLRG